MTTLTDSLVNETIRQCRHKKTDERDLHNLSRSDRLEVKQVLISLTDHDLKLLLDDEGHYSAHTIAQLLRLLSTLEYPAKAEKGKLKDDGNSVETPTEETVQQG